jgi:hypothetical protein
VQQTGLGSEFFVDVSLNRCGLPKNGGEQYCPAPPDPNQESICILRPGLDGVKSLQQLDPSLQSASLQPGGAEMPSA